MSRMKIEIDEEILKDLLDLAQQMGELQGRINQVRDSLERD